MDELKNQLLAIINGQRGFPPGNGTSPSHPNAGYDLEYDEETGVGDFPYRYGNLTGWEELQSIIEYHYNRSLQFRETGTVDQDCHPFGSMFDVIYSYYLPTMIFVGLVGNLLSCVVFLNTHLKMRSSSYYLAALACADFGFLTSLFLVWLNGTLDIPVFNIDGYCQCIVYVSSVCSFLSVWLIAAFTVERFIAVQYPLHRPHLCTVARAKAIVFYLVCISLTVHTYVFFTSGIIRLDDGSEVCEMLEGYREAMRVINIVDSVLTLIAPLLLIVVMNAMIVYNLVKFSKRFKSPDSELANRRSISLDVLGSGNKLNGGSGGGSTSRKNIFQGAFNASRNSSSFRRLQQLKSSLKSDGVHISNSVPEALPKETTKATRLSSDKKLISTRSQQSITKMLLLISSVFVLLNLPSYAIRLYVFIFFSIWAESPPVLLWCLQQMFMILYYTNFSINFLLYSMCGITFRRCLWQLVRKKVKKISRYQCKKPVECKGF